MSTVVTFQSFTMAAPLWLGNIGVILFTTERASLLYTPITCRLPARLGFLRANIGPLTRNGKGILWLNGSTRHGMANQRRLRQRRQSEAKNIGIALNWLYSRGKIGRV